MQIKLTLDRFEGNKAVLITANGQQIIWPKDQLPAGLPDGSILIFALFKEKEREKKDKQTAKDILNEIINQP
jgi:hypothetical protein